MPAFKIPMRPLAINTSASQSIVPALRSAPLSPTRGLSTSPIKKSFSKSKSTLNLSANSIKTSNKVNGVLSDKMSRLALTLLSNADADAALSYEQLGISLTPTIATYPSTIYSSEDGAYTFTVIDEDVAKALEDQMNAEFRTGHYQHSGTSSGISSGQSTAASTSQESVDASFNKDFEFGFKLPEIKSWDAFEGMIGVEGSAKAAKIAKRAASGSTLATGTSIGVGTDTTFHRRQCLRRGESSLVGFGKRSNGFGHRMSSTPIEKIMPELQFGVTCDLQALNVWA